MDQNNAVVIAVEVKDRELQLRHVQDKVPRLREKGIKELIFLIQSSINKGEEIEIKELIRKQFVTGQNIYIEDVQTFINVCMMLFGEKGRNLFIRCIGEELDINNADYKHKRAWVKVLSSI